MADNSDKKGNLILSISQRLMLQHLHMIVIKKTKQHKHFKLQV